MSILMKSNEKTAGDEILVSVSQIVKKHWAHYGRHFYCRYDYEGRYRHGSLRLVECYGNAWAKGTNSVLTLEVDTDSANKVMDLIRDKFIGQNIISPPPDKSGIKLVGAEEFS